MTEDHEDWQKQAAKESVKRNFDAAWSLYEATLKTVDADTQTLQAWELKRLCQAWYMLGYNAYRSGVGAVIVGGKTGINQ